jgi:hypothetical protein
MDDRIEKLEATAERTADRLSALECDVGKIQRDVSVLQLDVAVIKSNHATKSDVAEAKAAIADVKSSIIIWVVGTVFFAQVLPALLKQFGL